MLDRRVVTLVRELAAGGYESEYLVRLRRRMDVEQAYEDLEREILHEMACALGRAEDKLNAALLRLELAQRDLDSARGEHERSERARTFDALRETALEARYELVVHREAVGLRRNEMWEQLYPIPARARCGSQSAVSAVQPALKVPSPSRTR
jgi:hypothetical protein